MEATRESRRRAGASQSGGESPRSLPSASVSNTQQLRPVRTLHGPAVESFRVVLFFAILVDPARGSSPQTCYQPRARWAFSSDAETLEARSTLHMLVPLTNRRGARMRNDTPQLPSCSSHRDQCSKASYRSRVVRALLVVDARVLRKLRAASEHGATAVLAVRRGDPLFRRPSSRSSRVQIVVNKASLALQPPRLESRARIPPFRRDRRSPRGRGCGSGGWRRAGTC